MSFKHLLATFTVPPSLLKSESPAQQQLVTNLRLLHLIHHRNKNQHRRSAWYRHFDIFRRELNRFCQGLGLHFGLNHENLNTSSQSQFQSSLQSRSHSSFTSKQDSKHSTSLPNLPSHQLSNQLIHWTQTGLIERCFSAFTSILNDPSFAPLGLTLVALLARTCSLTGITNAYQAIAKAIHKDEAERQEQELGEALARFAEENPAGLRDVFGDKKSGLGDLAYPQDDTGTVISRDDSINSIPTKSNKRSQAPKLQVHSRKRHAAAAAEETNDARRPLKRQKPEEMGAEKMTQRKEGGEILNEALVGKLRQRSDGIFEEQAKERRTEKIKEGPKRGKKANAIDDLFAGL